MSRSNAPDPIEIPIERVPDILRAYAEGIEEHIRPIFPGTIKSMVNHDLNGTFCIWLNLSFDNRVFILEIGAGGVVTTDLYHYRERAAWEEKKEGPAPQPPTLDYSDPRLLQQIENGIKEYFKCHDQQ